MCIRDRPPPGPLEKGMGLARVPATLLLSGLRASGLSRLALHLRVGEGVGRVRVDGNAPNLVGFGIGKALLRRPSSADPTWSAL
eukprot:3909924-Alexandrium_andersonii.AAC.1